jgi:hypothetical protein
VSLVGDSGAMGNNVRGWFQKRAFRGYQSVSSGFHREADEFQSRAGLKRLRLRRVRFADSSAIETVPSIAAPAATRLRCRLDRSESSSPSKALAA